MKKVSRIVCLFLFLFAAWCNRAAADSLGTVSTFEGPVLLGFEDPFFLWCGSYGSQPFPLPRPKPDLWPDRPYCGSDGSDQPWPKPRCPEPELWPWDPKPWCPEPQPWPCGPKPRCPEPQPWPWGPWPRCHEPQPWPWSPWPWGPWPWGPWPCPPNPWSSYCWGNEGIETILKQPSNIWMDIDSKKLKSIAAVFYPETNNEKIIKQHWIWIDNEKLESIAPFLDPSYKMYQERLQYTPMLEDSIKDFYLK